MKTLPKIKFTSYLHLSIFTIGIYSFSVTGLALSNLSTPVYTSASAAIKLDKTNFGGGFVLEDWFFARDTVGHNVSSTCEEAKNGGVGSSQVFIGNALVKQVADFTWTSETDLIKKLSGHGYSPEDIEKIFQYHRDTYLGKTLENNEVVFTKLREAKATGIKIIRLPITWAIQYDKSYTFTKPDGQVVTLPAEYDIKGNTIANVPKSNGNVQLIQDPFYSDKKWASIPISQIEAVLKGANQLGMQVILDVHAFPGGSSDGTYNGVWPDAPRFWLPKKEVYQANFRAIFDRLVAWASDLKETDPAAFAGLAGLTPMNEPAHLMGFLEISKNEPLLSKKPVCSATDSTGKIISWGVQPKDVLDTLALAVEDFRASVLSKTQVKLVMNVIETMYNPNDYNPKDQKTYPFSLIGNWWLGITSPEERKVWAAVDIHHYVAWDGGCNNVLTAKHPLYNQTGDLQWNDPGVWKSPIFEKDSSGKTILQYAIKNPDGTYTIIDNDNFNKTYKKTDGTLFVDNRNGFAQIKACSTWFLNVRRELGILDNNELVFASEFSAGTNSDSWKSGSSGRALNNNKPITITNFDTYRNTFLEAQVKNAAEASVEAIFWTWKIENNNFSDWSLSTICNSAKKPSVCGGNSNANANSYPAY
ncbi:MAG: symbB [Burkholderiales bacterium]|jgi:hypothetical protein|nr:symbB [Burkholderiales bacterium]